MNILPDTGLTFDDVLLVPRYSTIKSRFSGDIDLSTTILPNIKLEYPIIAANMQTICEVTLANAMYEAGGLGIIHRFMSADEQRVQLGELRGPKIACVGVTEEEKHRYLYLSSQVNINGILIDVAHGDSKNCTDMITFIQKDPHYRQVPIIAGNVVTGRAAKDLYTYGASCIKIGLGSSKICSSRIKTGNGFPQLSAIDDCYQKTWANKNCYLIADGGLHNSGDILKALCVGADAVMSGSLFAGCKETPGEVIFKDGHQYKYYRGSASFAAQTAWKGQATGVEGVETLVPYTGKSVKEVMQELINGLLSGMSYQNARNLSELRKNYQFVRQTSCGLAESGTY
jgi:IMP dehydrogenase